MVSMLSQVYSLSHYITVGSARATSPFRHVPIAVVASRPKSGERSTPESPMTCMPEYLDSHLRVGMGCEYCSYTHYCPGASQNDVHANGNTELAAEGWLLNIEGRLSNGDGSMVNVASGIPDRGMPPRG